MNSWEKFYMYSELKSQNSPDCLIEVFNNFWKKLILKEKTLGEIKRHYICDYNERNLNTNWQSLWFQLGLKYPDFCLIIFHKIRSMPCIKNVLVTDSRTSICEENIFFLCFLQQ